MLRSILGVLVLATSASVAVSPTLLAQGSHPVVFVHGLLATGTTWADGGNYLASILPITQYRPTVGQSNPYSVQAQTLRNYIVAQGLDGSNTIAVGHSNGGIVSRQLSTFYPLKGIITVNSPNRGAPLSTRVGDLQTMASEISFSSAYLWWLIDYWNWENGDVDPVAYDAWLKGGAIASLASGAVYSIFQYVINQEDVISEMAPEYSGGEFFQTLNDAYNIDHEIQTIPNRIGITSTATAYYDGGMFTAHGSDPVDAIENSNTLEVFGWDMIFDGLILQTEINYNSQWWFVAETIVGAVFYLGDLGVLQRDIWCNMVGTYSGGYLTGTCYPNDGVVPTAYQNYPEAINYTVSGPSHTKATKHSLTLDRLTTVLQQIIQN